MPRPLFRLGDVVVTPDAASALHRHEVLPERLLARHWSGDWGDLDANDQAANDTTVRDGGRIRSAYRVGDDPDPIVIVTEPDRSATTIGRLVRR